MAFIIKKLAYRPWPVHVTGQECDPATGDITDFEQTFIGHFRPFCEAEFDELVAAEKGESVAPDTPLAEVLAVNSRIFCQLMVGWGEVTDEAGAAIPFSASALTGLVTGSDGLAFSAGINRALFELRYGAAKVKNSNTSAASGPPPASASAAEVMPETTSSPVTSGRGAGRKKK